MNMVIPNEGKLEILEELFKSEIARPTFFLDLFKNVETVGDDSTAADFDIADFPGYEQIEIARDGWEPAAEVADVGQIETTETPLFICTGGGGQLVYGWILRSTVTGSIWAGQNFDVARDMTTDTVEALMPFRIKCKTFA